MIEKKDSGEIDEEEFLSLLEEAREKNGSAQGVYLDQKV